MKETFSINDMALMTGLSTRTIRNYLNLGFLEGEKKNGAWAFTPEQVDAFLSRKDIRPVLRAKKNATVYDFLGAGPQDLSRMCVILDLPSAEASGASALFCDKISSYEPEAELTFSSEPIGKGLRIILSGSSNNVMDLLNLFRSR